ncbi:MAG TPA: SIMPL domain-containing protein [Alphaproteobacteria bacterium]|nr:SIMPL domain-containing protein [Alphaproteobacteria bacterium]HOO50680.1 SIMPL domain-containing protein [Alphaproteobacteria bacterium]
MKALALLGGLVALALAIGYSGEKILSGLKNFRNYDRYVVVKGLSTRDVVADQATWDFNFTATGRELSEAQTKIDEHDKIVKDYLVSQGIDADQITLQRLIVNDNEAKTYGEAKDIPRYVLTEALLVRTTNIEAMIKASQNITEIVRQGVVMGTPNGGWNPSPEYSFTKINDVKPEMIADSTKNARIAAEQFAKDSGQVVGNIRSANQGVLQIEARDPGVGESETPYKSVRVVSTVEYYLGE